MSRPTSSALNKLGALGGAPPTASRRPSTTSRGRTGTGSRTGTAYQMDAMKLALMDALVRKLRAKFPKDVKTQEVIGREVTAFMRADRETVSEADLTSLENKIAKLLKMGGGGEWGSVFEYEAAMHAEAETKKRTNKVETAKRMKAELDKQVRYAPRLARRNSLDWLLPHQTSVQATHGPSPGASPRTDGRPAGRQGTRGGH